MSQPSVFTMAEMALEAGWKGKFPIDPQEIAAGIVMVDRTTKQQIDIHVASQCLDGMSACTEWTLHDGEPLFRCIYNSNESKVRQRFAQAHSLGHVLLGHVSDTTRQLRDVRFNSDINYREWEANHFATSLLMPSKYLRHQASRNPNIDALANFFGVSPWAIRNRLIFMGILPQRSC